MITRLEELSINAFPALHTLLADGWVLRFAEGVTRRCNSINPLYSSRYPLLGKLRACETMYRELGLEVIFKMTPNAHPADLDDLLESEGYRREFGPSVQTVDLRTGDHPARHEVRLNERLTGPWFASLCRMNDMAAERAATLRKILRLIFPRHCFASIEQEGEVMAGGLAVVQDGYVGLYEIISDPRARRQGYGESVVQALLTWGQQAGAHTGYLQVMPDNDPAIRLYAKLGFEEQYQYWYRIKE